MIATVAGIDAVAKKTGVNKLGTRTSGTGTSGTENKPIFCRAVYAADSKKVNFAAPVGSDTGDIIEDDKKIWNNATT
ncbi:hypothetical protein [Nitrosopumilus sp.]|uniref:hypothetical protein n=1 Tax=Nitrosopumilus sp. TaxID=2024843 RepID=UPI003B5A853F